MEVFYSLLYCAFSIIFINSASAEANSDEHQQIVFQAKEIKDEKELYKRAVKGIQEVKLTNEELPKYELKNKNTKEDVKLSHYTTSQLLKVENDGDTEVQEFAVTTFAVTEEETASLNSRFSVASLNNDYLFVADSGSKREEKWDDSISVKAVITIYYSRITKNGVDYAKVTKASGGWTISDSSVSLSNRKVSIGSSGWPVNSQSIEKKPTENSWNYSTPFTWEYISLNAGHHIGANSTVTLKRGGSSWELTLNNRL